MKMITVYPTKASALHLVHPTHGKLRAGGGLWPKDVFTSRRLVDKSVSETKPAEPAVEPVESEEATA